MANQRIDIPVSDVRILKPLLRAYAFGYLTATGPRLYNFLRTARRSDSDLNEKLHILYTILKTSTQINRFPTACAVTVAGATALPRLLATIIRRVFQLLAKDGHTITGRTFFRRLRFVCTFLSAWFAFDLLNRDQDWNRKRTLSRSAAKVDKSNLESPNQHHLPPPSFHPQYAGKTIDFTLFAFFRALDIAVITTWTRTRSKSWHPEHQAPQMVRFLKNVADPWIFASSAAVIMWSWFYAPERLPRAYNLWISKSADIDSRLITALRLARRGDFVYGQDTGQAHLLAGVCKDLHLPEDYGDPAKTIPIPCELCHCGVSKECEAYAISKFVKSWKFAMKLYLPLQMLTKLRSPSVEALYRACKDAARSSSFLAAFTSLFCYSVCLARTRLGPKVFSKQTVTPQMWDSGLCVLAGCLSCGWAILLEKPSRRQEIAFFVAPRALATLLPRVYDKQYRRREQLVFASSVAIVLGAAQNSNVAPLRGVFGRLMRRILQV